MGQKLVVGPINKGLRNDRTAFVIDNDSFPTLTNAYQWRGRVKRKRGTSFLGRLTRFFNSTISSYSSTATFNLVGGAGNLLTGFSLQANGNIVPGSVSIIDTTTLDAYTDDSNGNLIGIPAGTGTINYATGAITITGGAAHAVSATFIYYPDLPVMGLEDLILEVNQFPKTLGFDTTYSYNILTTDPFPIYDVSFYKNPPVNATTLPGYVPKTNITPTTWNGQDYQQFWTVNYQGALWATNGITVPFSTTNIGMQFKAITGVSITNVGNGTTIPAVADLTIVGHGLVIGDFVFINEVVGITGINFQTGYITAVVNPNTVTVTFPFATLGGIYASGGIAQYLTNRSDVTRDCLRWYDGDPTNGSATNPILDGNKGWVNFAPPLCQGNYSIADLPARQYYLVGARMIVPFKDRLLFIGPVVQTSDASPNPIYLRDTVIYSQNGTPYYTSSYTNNPNAAVDNPTSPTNNFHPILLPDNQTATPSAYFEDQTGFGGFISAGVDMAITTAYPNEDVIIMGLDRIQTRFVYTGNDIVPFNFFTINSELGSGSTFSGIVMDKGVITKGSRGYIITNQVETRRIDPQIPDQVFEVNYQNNGTERICAKRDYINEWIYITYPANYLLEDTNLARNFPSQTLLYNYRDDSWAIFNESYTHYGHFRRSIGFTWGTVGETYPTWADWNEPWNAGTSTLFDIEVIAGNQQGFVVFRDEGTGESNSLYIRNIVGNVVTSPSHNLDIGDYIIINDVIGTAGALVNGRIFSVGSVTTNTFTLNPSVASGTYVGGGVIKKMYVPLIQTKQFPVAWEMARKTRIGPQQYLFSRTDNGQITLLIFLSQNSASAYNDSTIVPSNNVVNNSLIYSTILYTCPESTNLGLTPANINLNSVTAANQNQIWHRMNTSLIGDTVQIGFTLSDEQMRSLDVLGDPFAITGASQATQCVLTIAADFEIGQLIKITGVVGMTQLNFNTTQNNFYIIVSTSPTTVTINVDSTTFTPYISGGIATVVAPVQQFEEIELHSFILDISQSQLLA